MWNRNENVYYPQSTNEMDKNVEWRVEKWLINKYAIVISEII